MPADIAIETLIDTYCAAWSDPDPAERRKTLVGVWAVGGTYTDPTVHAASADELLAHISGVFAHRPGTRVVRTSAVDLHHDVARFAWRVVFADGTMSPEGIDFAEFTADWKIRRIVGFFGPLAKME